MFRALAVLLLVCSSSLGATLGKRTTSPSVKITNGTIIGHGAHGVDTFLGIPFAQPPTGTQRLRPPQSITTTYGTITATSTPTGCPQINSSFSAADLPPKLVPSLQQLPSDLFQAILKLTSFKVAPQGEDCLTLNVQRPSTVTSKSRLPVLVYIYGGDFETGSTQGQDATSIIQTSIGLSEPIIFVQANYRLAAFGFLAAKELADEGSTNLGLRDQRLALHWVAENIEAFGGDPDRVTIFGESAGAWSVTDQLLINGGDNTYKGKPLFGGAIMNSGATLPTHPVDSARAQYQFETVAKAAGCDDATSKVDCLRKVPFEVLNKAQNVLPSGTTYVSLNQSYVARPDPRDSFFSMSPDLAITSGKYAKVPIISGNQEDEGTLFSLFQANLSTADSAVVDYFQSWWPESPSSIVRSYVDTYSAGIDASDGSPFNSPGKYQLYPGYKRLSALIGDFTFIFQRRRMLETTAAAVPTYSYLSTYLKDTSALGTFHASDVLQTYLSLPSQTTAWVIQAYYINFIYNRDPNKGSSPKEMKLKEWPRYTRASKQMIDFGANGSLSLIKDDFRQKSYEVFAKNSMAFTQ